MDDFRIAGKAIIVKDNALLILKRASDDVQKPGIWEIPGGRLELKEDPRMGTAREILEETGLHVNVLYPLNVRHFTRTDKQTITMLVFLCTTEDDKVMLSKEHSAYEWVDIKECKNKLTDFFHEEVDIYMKFYRLSSHLK